MLGAIGSTGLTRSNYYQVMIDGKLVELGRIIESESDLRGSFKLLLNRMGIRKIVLLIKISRQYTLMNAGTHDELPQENPVPTWLLPCTCGAQRCHCNARCKPNILCIIYRSSIQPPPTRSPYTKTQHTIYKIYVL